MNLQFDERKNQNFEEELKKKTSDKRKFTKTEARAKLLHTMITQVKLIILLVDVR